MTNINIHDIKHKLYQFFVHADLLVCSAVGGCGGSPSLRDNPRLQRVTDQGKGVLALEHLRLGHLWEEWRVHQETPPWAAREVEWRTAGGGLSQRIWWTTPLGPASLNYYSILLYLTQWSAFKLTSIDDVIILLHWFCYIDITSEYTFN